MTRMRYLNRSRKLLVSISLVFLLMVCLLFVAEVTHLGGFAPVKNMKNQLSKQLEFLNYIGNTSQYSSPKYLEFTRLKETLLFEGISKEQPSIPVDFWYNQAQLKTLQFNKTCAKFPEVVDIQFLNDWQFLEMEDGTGRFQLYAAYYDKRRENILGPVVRIISMVQQLTKKDNQLIFPDVTCQIWCEESTQPILTKVFAKEYLWLEEWGKPKEGQYHPYILTCVLPEGNTHVPKAVSLVEKTCDTAGNLVKVFYDNDQALRAVGENSEPRICVCIKSTNELEDKSLRFIEWCEWLKLAGITHVYISIHHVHLNIQKVLKYYSQEGFLTVKRFQMPFPHTNTPHLLFLRRHTTSLPQLDMLAFNDCLLRNIYNHNYVIPLELDEIPVVAHGKTLQDVLRKVPKDKDAYTMFRVPYLHASSASRQKEPGEQENASKLKESLWFLNNQYKLKETEEFRYNKKCLYSTKTLVMIHNHYPFKTLSGRIEEHEIDKDIAHIEQHFVECPDVCVERELFDDGKRIDYEGVLLKNVLAVARVLEFY